MKRRYAVKTKTWVYADNDYEAIMQVAHALDIVGLQPLTGKAKLDLPDETEAEFTREQIEALGGRPGDFDGNDPYIADVEDD